MQSDLHLLLFALNLNPSLFFTLPYFLRSSASFIFSLSFQQFSPYHQFVFKPSYSIFYLISFTYFSVFFDNSFLILVFITIFMLLLVYLLSLCFLFLIEFFGFLDRFSDPFHTNQMNFPTGHTIPDQSRTSQFEVSATTDCPSVLSKCVAWALGASGLWSLQSTNSELNSAQLSSTHFNSSARLDSLFVSWISHSRPSPSFSTKEDTNLRTQVIERTIYSPTTTRWFNKMLSLSSFLTTFTISIIYPLHRI